MAQVQKPDEDETTYTFTQLLRERGYDEAYIKSAADRMDRKALERDDAE